MARIGHRLTVNTLRIPSWKPSDRQQNNHGTRRAPCEKPICASTLLPLKATMRKTEAHGSIPTASTRTFTSLLDTSTRTDILTTATPGSGVSLSWRKGISTVESDKLHQCENCERQNNAIDDERQHSNLFDESQKVVDTQIGYYCRYRRSISK